MVGGSIPPLGSNLQGWLSGDSTCLVNRHTNTRVRFPHPAPKIVLDKVSKFWYNVLNGGYRLAVRTLVCETGNMGSTPINHPNADNQRLACVGQTYARFESV